MSSPYTPTDTADLDDTRVMQQIIQDKETHTRLQAQIYRMIDQGRSLYGMRGDEAIANKHVSPATYEDMRYHLIAHWLQLDPLNVSVWTVNTFQKQFHGVDEAIAFAILRQEPQTPIEGTTPSDVESPQV